MALTLALTFLLALSMSTNMYILYIFSLERQAEREDFLTELRRKSYLAKGLSPDEVSSTLTTEDAIRGQIKAEAKRLAKVVPKDDNAKEEPRIPGQIAVKLPTGQTLNLEKI